MANSIIKLFLFSLSLLSLNAFALDYETHIGGGLNVDTYKEDLPGNFELRDDFGFAPTLGVKGTAFWGNVGFRSGLFFEWKKVDIEDRDAAPGEDDIRLTAYYLAVPLNLQFNINEKWAIFGGLTPRGLLAKRCEDCGRFDDDPEYFVNYSNGGISYKFNDKWSIDVNFQHGLGDNFKDLKSSTSQVLFLYQL